MKAARIILITLGVLVTLFGGWELLTENRPASLLGLAIWLIGALILHDGVLAGIIVLTNRLLQGFLSGAQLAAAQAGLGIMLTFALIWVPVVIANGKVTQVSALPLDYGTNLIAVLVISGLITVGLVSAFTLRKNFNKVEGGAAGANSTVPDADSEPSLRESVAQPVVTRARWAVPLAGGALLIGGVTLLVVQLRRRST